MKKGRIFCCCGAMMAAAILGACSGKGDKDSEGFPKDFNNLDDASKVAYVMKNASPDSVARFICDASLGKVANVTIDTFPIAAAYAFEHYNDSCIYIFSRELDGYSENLPLPEKMRIYMLMGKTDAQRLGYRLGLEYVNHIRENKMTVEQVSEEIKEFKNACADDSVTYRRFVKGFHIVLAQDHGKDLPEDIYSNFINL